MDTTAKHLMDRFGPLMNFDQLSGVLHRTRDGLRISLRRNSAYAQQLNSARIKIGRRVYFRTVEIARLLDGEEQG
jgi:hypothetical protein